MNWLTDTNDKLGTFTEENKVDRTDEYKWISPENKDIKDKMLEKTGNWAKFIGLGD